MQKSQPHSRTRQLQQLQPNMRDRCELCHKLCLAARKDLHQSKTLQTQTTVTAESSAAPAGTTRQDNPASCGLSLEHSNSAAALQDHASAQLHRRRWEVSHHVPSCVFLPSDQHDWTVREDEAKLLQAHERISSEGKKLQQEKV